MRELKFRLWDEGHFAYFDLRSLTGHWSASVGDCVTGVEVMTEENNLLADAPLMQYTGRKDKNGKEIYEGDILGGPVLISLYVIDDFDDFMHDVTESMIVCTELEVVGNVHENPEMAAR